MVDSWCHTEFEEYDFSHRWTISNYSDRTRYNGGNTALLSPSFSPEEKGEQWILKLVPSQACGSPLKYCVGVYVSLVSDLPHKVWMKYKISLSRKDQVDHCREQSSYTQIAKGSQYGLPNFIEKDVALNLQNGYLVNDTLTLYCTIYVKLLDTPQHSTGRISRVPVQDFCLPNQLEEARQKGLFTDVVLVAGDKEFKAHRVVLATQSSFFSTRFQERWSQGDNRVQMADIDPSILEAILNFLYTGEIAAVSMMAEKLLSVAEEYELENLRLACEQELSRSITVENVLSMLVLADTHRARYLKATCLDFVVANSSSLLKSEEWDQLKKSKQHEDTRMEVLEELLDRKH